MRKPQSKVTKVSGSWRKYNVQTTSHGRRGQLQARNDAQVTGRGAAQRRAAAQRAAQRAGGGFW